MIVEVGLRQNKARPSLQSSGRATPRSITAPLPGRSTPSTGLPPCRPQPMRMSPSLRADGGLRADVPTRLQSVKSGGGGLSTRLSGPSTPRQNSGSDHHRTWDTSAPCGTRCMTITLCGTDVKQTISCRTRSARTRTAPHPPTQLESNVSNPTPCHMLPRTTRLSLPRSLAAVETHRGDTCEPAAPTLSGRMLSRHLR